MKCVYCEENINIENKSKEHIIQNALGGLLESYDICCEKCNNIVQKCIDKEFCEIFSPIITQVPRLKKTNKSAFPSCNGLAIYKEDNNLYEVKIKNKKVIDCIQFKQKYKKNLSNDDLKNFKIVGYNFDISNRSFKNGISKIAFNFALAKGIPYKKLKNIVSVNKIDSKIKEINFLAPLIPFVALNPIDEFLELDIDLELYHNLILFNFNNLLFCYVDLFNTFQFYILLSDSWDGSEIYESYLQVIEKIERELPKFNISRTKHILILSEQYNVQPTFDLKKIYKEIGTVIKKKPYEKDMIDFISNKQNWKYFDGEKEDFLKRKKTYNFYFNSDYKLIPQRFKIFTPTFSEDNSYTFYPNHIVNLIASEFDYKRYTFGKFNRLTKYLLESQITD